MLRNHLFTSIRHFLRDRSYSAVNVFGLALGIACSVAIFLFVYDELTYDGHHRRSEEIYRLHGGWRSMHDGSSGMYAAVGYFMGDILRQEFPEVDDVTRFRRLWEMRVEKPGTDEFYLEHIYLTDSTIFDVFTLPFIHGDAHTALSGPNSVVLSAKTALKYFNRTDVVGEQLRWLAMDTVELKVTGVIQDYPSNTHHRFDLLTRLTPPANMRDEWFEYRYYTYFTLHPDADTKSLEARVKYFTKRHVESYEQEIGFIQEHEIIPFSKIHLHSQVMAELETNSKAAYVYLFLAVGIFILVMACINFMNLATARSMKRAREIGIRKVVGALKRQLVLQFLGEAFFTTVVAAIVATLALSLLLPALNDFTGKTLSLFSAPVFVVMIVLAVVAVTLLAGGYPAFFLSAFRPVDTLKGTFRSSGRGIVLRKSLVIFQFCISVSLIAGTLIVLRHIHFLRDKELGFTTEKIVTVTGASRAVKERVLGITGVKRASFSNRIPGTTVGGRTIINGWNESDRQLVLGQLAVDYDFVDLYELELIAGRKLDEGFTSDAKSAFLVNEAALERLGIANAEDAIGVKLWLQEWGDIKGTIVGVLRDFHFVGVNAPIEPFCMFVLPGGGRYLSVKVAGGKLPDVLERLEAIYREELPGRPFEYSFLDESFDRQYHAEDRFMLIFSVFALVAILIGCLGLYGLAMFMAEQRAKEVSVRKVLGASGKNILILLTGDFLKLVMISFVVAVPIAWIGMERWLASFPYREEINPGIFVITAVSVLVITFATVAQQAWRVVVANPAHVLRKE